MAYQNIKIPETGSKITLNDDGSLNVPNDPIIPYIEGDGIGIDITPAMLNVCLLYTSPSPRDATLSRMPSSA